MQEHDPTDEGGRQRRERVVENCVWNSNRVAEEIQKGGRTIHRLIAQSGQEFVTVI